MMAQNDLVVAGIDIAKDKVDACIRSLSQRRTLPSTAEGRRQLISWLRKHKATKAVMEASGGYEREWAKALREKDIEVRIVDPKRVRHFAKSAGRLGSCERSQGGQKRSAPTIHPPNDPAISFKSPPQSAASHPRSTKR